ncbi:hypothetical protein AMATHDRAFT_11360 [Amanita thiersii Skay4041]|uniref:Integrase catalytic domain-containing protein n=1 Tax=Amanita thiersii Skay4041 TaxID=703135 RepID=A0A2A9NAG2_9AGAR|nr:hypothetical protein AMATHDRAFT_11360 [Amanita thiersii Skay4041]
MRELYKILGISGNYLTTFHLQTDGQTECINQELEEYLHISATMTGFTAPQVILLS